MAINYTPGNEMIAPKNEIIPEHSGGHGDILSTPS